MLPAPGEICQLHALKTARCSISAASMDGVPIVCGGHYGSQLSMSNECYKLDKDQKDWIPVRQDCKGLNP